MKAMDREVRLVRSIPRSVAALAAAALLVSSGACVGDQDTKNMAAVFAGTGGQPDELPVMLNKQPPFRYPMAAYAQKIQGNTTLRIYIDANGNIAPDSTRVVESSGNAALDSAAVVGSRELRFVPAKRNGQGEGVSILFPVYWRHPDAPPLPGDTILNRRPRTP
ncbi:MAG: energy transducer TonB [Gemmatimonadaceae bacterium]|nr:energy transducer TonB [Gemmatimonadaceae bacterium]NUS97921.1 energy transducer TonB [Gemmatimonadaceae bacterium]